MILSFFLQIYASVMHKITVIMPPPFIMGGGAYSITLVRTSVRTSVHMYVHTYVRPVRTKMVFGRYLLKTLGYWIHISYTGI